MTEDEIVAALKAIAHPVRYRILQALSGNELNVGEIDEAAEIGQPTLSQQLAVLRKAGLVSTRKDAKLVFYEIDHKKLATISTALGALAKVESGPSPARRQPTPGAANFAQLN